MRDHQPPGSRVIIGALSGLFPALGFGLLAIVSEPVGGYSMGTKVTTGWWMAAGYLVLGLVAGAVTGAAAPFITSARRAALVATAIALIPFGLLTYWTQDGLGVGELLAWSFGLALGVGGGIGAMMYKMLRAFGDRTQSKVDAA